MKEERDKNLKALTRKATRLLKNKTITKVDARPHSEGCDGENVLRLTFSDGTVVDFQGGYGGYTGDSCDEYFEWIDVCRVKS